MEHPPSYTRIQLATIPEMKARTSTNHHKSLPTALGTVIKVRLVTTLPRSRPGAAGRRADVLVASFDADGQLLEGRIAMEKNTQQ